MWSRLAFYSILSNLVVFLNSRLGLDDRTADTVAFLFSGVCYVTPVIGGWCVWVLLGVLVHWSCMAAADVVAVVRARSVHHLPGCPAR